MENLEKLSFSRFSRFSEQLLAYGHLTDSSFQNLENLEKLSFSRFSRFWKQLSVRCPYANTWFPNMENLETKGFVDSPGFESNYRPSEICKTRNIKRENK